MLLCRASLKPPPSRSIVVREFEKSGTISGNTYRCSGHLVVANDQLINVVIHQFELFSKETGGRLPFTQFHKNRVIEDIKAEYEKSS